MKKKSSKQTDHEILVEMARRAINMVVDDKSVDHETTLEDLDLLMADIECCVDGLDDIKKD
jgi:hypothetical protein